MSGHRNSFSLWFMALFAVAAVTVSGYFFAQKKSQPVFRNKVERIMFERKNKSPKYILTLPEKTEKTPLKPVEPQEDKPIKLETIDDFVKATPLLAKLKDYPSHYSLTFVERQPDFSENIDGFWLPKIAPNGQKPWIAYGKQIDVAPNFYKVAIILKNIGMDKNVFASVNKALPSQISFSFSPYTQNAKDFIIDARKNGHETYMDLLLASKDVLKADNGPLSMGITVSSEENMKRLYKSLSVDAPVGGMVVVDGMIDDTTQNQLKNYFQELDKRGLLMVDATLNNAVDDIVTENLSRKKADIVIAQDISPENIQKQLMLAENTAKEKGQVLIVALPKPIVVTALLNWVQTFSPQLSYEQMKAQNITAIERPFALVPVSNLVVE